LTFIFNWHTLTIRFENIVVSYQDQDMSKRPDVIFLVLDTQRADRLSCYGYQQSEISLALDSLASEATLFTQAIAPAQWTMPAHASMFTGLYPTQHQVVQMNSVLDTQLLTLAERLQQKGYYTAGFSHNPLVGVINNGLQRGFHQFANYNYLGAGLLTARLNESENQTGVTVWLRQRSRFFLAELLGYSRLTSAHYLSSLVLPVWQTVLNWRGKSKAAHTWTSLEAAAQLLIRREYNHPEQPVFTFINLMGTHVPYAPSSWAVERYLPKVLGRDSARSWLQWANSVQVDVANWLDMASSVEDKKAVLEAFYDAEVATQDALVGRFVTLLHDAGMLDNAWLVIVADHGDHLGEKARLNHVFGLYQPLVHVPLLIRFPGNNEGRGRLITTPASTRRLFHTLLMAAGAATADEQALSLVNEATEDVFAEGYPLEWATGRIDQQRPGLIANHGYDQPVRALYANERKLIQTADKSELYDLHSDYQEEHNLVDQEIALRESMQLRLQQFVQTIQSVTKSISTSSIDEDAALMEQLRRLGYIE
jgi:arylsulfatase A-like enzyme